MDFSKKKKKNFFRRLKIIEMKGKLQTWKIKYMAHKTLVLVVKELL